MFLILLFQIVIRYGKQAVVQFCVLKIALDFTLATWSTDFSRWIPLQTRTVFIKNRSFEDVHVPSL